MATPSVALRASAALATPHDRPCRTAPARAVARRTSRLLCRAAKDDENVFDKLKKKAAEIIPSTEFGENDGRGGRETTKGSIIELIGFGLGAPVPSDVRVDRENMKVYMDFEANNFEVEGKYRDEGWVDDSPPAPSFWDKLFGKKTDDGK